jgi:hypothetical protein
MKVLTMRRTPEVSRIWVRLVVADVRWNRRDVASVGAAERGTGSRGTRSRIRRIDRIIRLGIEGFMTLRCWPNLLTHGAGCRISFDSVVGEESGSLISAYRAR